MKIEQAKRIPIQKLAQDFGARYSHDDRQGNIWYFSPFRPDEKTASFKINPNLNTWHDFGMSSTSLHRKQGAGGDVIDLCCDLHALDRRLGIKDALNILLKYVPGGIEKTVDTQTKYQPTKAKAYSARYKILKQYDRITHYGLKDELVRRKITIELAEIYLKQAQIIDTVRNSKYYVFLFENDKGGHEVIIPNPKRGTTFKTCIGAKASTRILNSDERTKSVDVFEGVFDFLSWLEIMGKKIPTNHSFILNSVSMAAEVAEKILAFKDTAISVYLYLDNDEAGYQTTHWMAELLQENFSVGGMEQLYEGHKDLSEYWMKKKFI